VIYALDVLEYATQRRPVLAVAENSLIGSVKHAIRRHQSSDWYDALIRRSIALLRRAYRTESGKAQARGQSLDAAIAQFETQLQNSLDKLEPEGDINIQARRVAASIASAAYAAGTMAAAQDSGESGLEKVWIDMDDNRVRPAHRDVDPVPLGRNFVVGGVPMSRPGDMRAPIELWINCRCILGIRPVTASISTATLDPTEGEAMDLTDFADAEVVDLVGDDEDNLIPWHGVLAPEGVMSGDRRKFSPDALTWRDLPLPLSWQKVNAEGHDGSVVVGRIDEIWRDAGLIHGKGFMLGNAEADEAVGLLAEQGIRGISVDVDSAVMQLEDDDGNALDGDTFAENAVMNLTSGRICGATLCAIPAFMEAHIYLGVDDNESLAAAGDCVPCQYAAGIDEGPWDGSAGGYTDQEWYDATLIHLGTGEDKLTKSNNKLPIRTPSGKLSRAGVHAAAGRIGQTDAPPGKISSAKAALRGAYQVLGEEPPDSLKASAEEIQEFGEFGEYVKTEDGPGWLTHPVDTERLRRYWTKGKGALKIRWGVPGDFNRCRLQLAKYIKPQYLNGYCANRHYDALGFWPGRPTSADAQDFSGPALHLVASAPRPDAGWFRDPHLTGPAPIVVTGEGRVYGHLATWGQCHIGFGEKDCVLAPNSPSNYAYYMTGAVLTDEGDIPVGHITMGTGHPGPTLGAARTMAHYDNTGTVVALVAAGEDAYGIWLAGMVTPQATDEQIDTLRGASLSGDWRSIAGSLELVAALAVNVPGFPIPRTQLAADGGRQISLVASGIVPSAPIDEAIFDIDKFAEAVVDHMAARQRRDKMKAIKTKAGRDPRSRMAELAKVTRG